MALITGIVDTAFLGGATFSYLVGLLYVSMVVLAVIGFAGLDRVFLRLRTREEVKALWT